MNMKTKTILIVESDKTCANNIAKLLKGEGYQALFVSTAQEAIDTCIKKIIDLIILELNLKDKDGMVVIDTVRSFTNTLPIIVVSSRANVESKVMAFDTGANDYVTKPFNNYELLARIRNQFRYQKEEKEKKLGMESTKSCRAFEEFFLNLEAVLSAEDHVKSFQYLKQARHIAVELISRESDAPDGNIARLHEP